MAAESNVEFTIAITDPQLDDEDKQKLTRNLLNQLRQLDEVEQVERTENLQKEAGSRDAFSFLVATLTAEVSMKNVKAFLGFLGERLGNKPIKVKVKVGDKEVEMEASSREEILAAEQLVDRLLKSMQEGKNA